MPDAMLEALRLSPADGRGTTQQLAGCLKASTLSMRTSNIIFLIGIGPIFRKGQVIYLYLSLLLFDIIANDKNHLFLCYK